MRASAAGKTGRSEHISGAETICSSREIPATVSAFTKRGLSHSRGAADKVVITIERLSAQPLRIAALPLATLHSSSPEKSRSLVSVLLSSLGIPSRAVRAAFAVTGARRTMRGAALVDVSTGKRLETDRWRGVRASLLGLGPRASAVLGRRLGRLGLNTPTVTEALVLASKIASCNGVIAELCVSDDPDYTTGYVASRQYGYLRIPNIKEPGDRRGGRVIFLDSTADPAAVASYLETTPAVVSRISQCRGQKELDEILGRHHQ
ncbi:MAG: 6-carboxyhexanoate--CoA ligase [Thermodesulfovibrionales bacterium]